MNSYKSTIETNTPTSNEDKINYRKEKPVRREPWLSKHTLAIWSWMLALSRVIIWIIAVLVAQRFHMFH